MHTENEIFIILQEWADAIRKGNMAGILANHANNIVMFDVPAPLQAVGIGEYKKTWDLFFQYSPGGEGSFELDELKITAGDTVAFCHALLRIGGNSIPECRLTVGFEKVNGRWLITHEHHSAPSPL